MAGAVWLVVSILFVQRFIALLFGDSGEYMERSRLCAETKTVEKRCADLPGGLASKLFGPYEHEAAERAGVWDDWSTMSWSCRGVSFPSISIRGGCTSVIGIVAFNRPKKNLTQVQNTYDLVEVVDRNRNTSPGTRMIRLVERVMSL